MFPFPSKKKPVVPSVADDIFDQFDLAQREIKMHEIVMRHQRALAEQNMRNYYATLHNAAQVGQQMAQQPMTQAILNQAYNQWTRVESIDVDALVRERDELKEENSSLRRMIEASKVVVEE